MRRFGPSDTDECIFRELIESHAENKHCFTCNRESPQWCVYSHGLFVCLQCSGLFRALGTHLAQVRSMTLDTWLNWNECKLQQMVGGNNRAKMYLNHWNRELAHSGNTPEGLVVELKQLKLQFESKEAQLYRKMIETEATGQVFREEMFEYVDYSALNNQGSNDKYVGLGSNHIHTNDSNTGNSTGYSNVVQYLEHKADKFKDMTAKSTLSLKEGFDGLAENASVKWDKVKEHTHHGSAYISNFITNSDVRNESIEKMKQATKSNLDIASKTTLSTVTKISDTIKDQWFQFYSKQN